MSMNRGKDFESIIRHSFEDVSDTFVLRLPDPTNGYLGIRNISDFLIYHHPYLYVIECKSVHGNTLPLRNITDNQWRGMHDAIKNRGVVAGVICWWIDHDVTKFIPIEALELEKFAGAKSVRYDDKSFSSLIIEGRKKRVFFDYNMIKFFDDVSKSL